MIMIRNDDDADTGNDDTDRDDHDDDGDENDDNENDVPKFPILLYCIKLPLEAAGVGIFKPSCSIFFSIVTDLLIHLLTLFKTFLFIILFIFTIYFITLILTSKLIYI